MAQGLIPEADLLTVDKFMKTIQVQSDTTPCRLTYSLCDAINYLEDLYSQVRLLGLHVLHCHTH